MMMCLIIWEWRDWEEGSWSSQENQADGEREEEKEEGEKKQGRKQEKFKERKRKMQGAAAKDQTVEDLFGGEKKEFFWIPAVIKHQGKQTVQLSTSCHNKWTRTVRIMSTSEFAVIISLKVGDSMWTTFLSPVASFVAGFHLENFARGQMLPPAPLNETLQS